jgi:hypothetical protein
MSRFRPTSHFPQIWWLARSPVSLYVLVLTTSVTDRDILRPLRNTQ